MTPVITVAGPSGPPDAPLLVLGPSLGTSIRQWEAAAALLRRDFRVLTWDLPGHGASPVTTEPFTVADLARAVLLAVEATGGDRFLYAGVSLGGAVGLEMLLAAPERVAGAAIICSGAKIGTPQSWAERASAVRARGTESLVEAFATRWFAPTTPPEVTDRLLEDLTEVDDESYALCAEALATYDVTARLDEIRMPVLAVWAEHDIVTPEPSATAIADGVGNGRIARITGAAHLAAAEKPAELAALLRSFFAETSA